MICRYTESLYALFSLGGLYHLTSGADNLAMLSFAASGSARSNGVLNAGYIGYHTMHQAYNAMFIKRNVYVSVYSIFFHFLFRFRISHILISFHSQSM